MKRVKIKVASVSIGGKLYKGGVEVIVDDQIAEWLKKFGYGKIIEDIKVEEGKTPPHLEEAKESMTVQSEEVESDGEKEGRKKREKKKE